MLLSTGTRLGPYEIVAPLGAGGMGEVYKASDIRLGRAVAVKISAEHFSERFEREARVIATLNHPNICTLHDVGPNYLVMELIGGPTLAERIAQGPIPLPEALDIGRQIAEALQAAHEKGVVHRDLKPANIKLTEEGKVKVLDFGLAKARESAAAAAAGRTEDSPTLTLPATGVGVILGTAGYMSPEQARGGIVDKRADIWAFGVVLYEMLTGRRMFEGDTVSDRLAAVLKTDPDWGLLPSETPASIRKLLRRCVERDCKRRLADIADARLEIEEALAPGEAEVPLRHPIAWLPWTLAGALALALMLLGALHWRAARPVEHPLTRLNVDLGPDAMMGLNLTAAISPDGRRLVFPARGPNGKQQLATRLLDQAQTTLLPGTENGKAAFFSPDSQWVGFFAGGKLKKMSVQGGASVTLCDAPYDFGATWGEDGTIVAALGLTSGLSRVPAAGGRPEPVTRPAKGERTHRWPQILPGSHAAIFTAALSGIWMGNASVKAVSLESGATKTLASGYFGRYLPANGARGYLVYLHQGVLLGAAFDPVRQEIQGTPLPLLEDVAANSVQGGGQFDSSATGTLVYLAGKGAVQTWPVMWLDSYGRMQPLIATPGVYSLPQFSPDGLRLALTVTTGDGPEIYSYDWQRETMTRLTFGGRAAGQVWTPDGKHIAFSSSAGDPGIWWVRSDGSGDAQRLLKSQTTAFPFSFSPDGRRLAYNEFNPESDRDIWTLPLDTSDPDHPKPGKPELFLGTPSDELAPMFSPDGRWIAYRSNESGTFEVFVRPFPAGRGGKWQISTGGGLYGFWSNNGRELFYETADTHIMEVDYTVNGDSFMPGKPHVWSDKQIYNAGNVNLALAPDGKRFAVFPIPEDAGPGKESVHVTFLLNFFDELRRRIPPPR